MISNLSSISLDYQETLKPMEQMGFLKMHQLLCHSSNLSNLSYLSNFLRSLELPLINCKLELKHKWTKYCVLTAAGADNDDANFNIIFTIEDTKLYVSVVILSARDHQQLSKRLSEGFKRSVYWNKYKTKRERKKTRNKCKYFHKSNLENIGVNRLFVLVYSNQGDNAKRFKT